MYSRQDFIEFILDHYENRRHHGPLSPASIIMKGRNPICGDQITLYLRINLQTQIIDDISFTGEGCTISQAAASFTTTKIKGQSLDYVRTLRASEILEELGANVMRNRRRCATLALHTLRAALKQYLLNNRLILPLILDEENDPKLQFEQQEANSQP